MVDDQCTPLQSISDVEDFSNSSIPVQDLQQSYEISEKKKSLFFLQYWYMYLMNPYP